MKSILKNLKVYKLGHGGIGISSLSDGKKVLIKGGALPGSTVDVTVVKRRKDYIEAHILETKKYDEKTADGEIFCPHFFIPKGISEVNVGTHKIGCGGCKWQMMSYNTQLNIKQQLVEDAFKKLNKNLDEKGKKIQVLPIIPSPLDKGYRNKIEFSFGVYKQQNPEFRKLIKEGKSEEEILKTGINKYDIDCNQCCGFHKQGEFAKIVNVDNCQLISEKMNQVYETIKTLCFNSGLPVFDQKTHQGFFRHLVIREGIHTQQLMVNLSVSLGNLDGEQTKLWEQLMEDFKKDEFLKKNITTFVITYNEGLSDTVKNDQSETKVFRGDGYIHEQLNFIQSNKNKDEMIDEENELSEEIEINNETKLTFRISPFSFFQTNTLGAEKLFGTAFNMLGNIEGNLLDLYCGAGSIGLSLLKQNNGKNKNSELIGIEIVEDAIRDANVNANINGLENQSFFVASPCEKVLNKFPELEEKIKNIGIIIVDPPREGLHPNVIEWIGKLKKEYKFKLLYISCNPVTMARDIEMLINNQGFNTKEVQPVDMFPHTHHIENICILE